MLDIAMQNLSAHMIHMACSCRLTLDGLVRGSFTLWLGHSRLHHNLASRSEQSDIEMLLLIVLAP